MSVSDLSYLINRHQSQPIRTGAISSFPNFSDMVKGFGKVASALPTFDATEYNQRYGNPSSPPNVLNIALRLFKEEDDMLDAFIALPDASSQEPRSTSRMLGPTSTSVSLGNKRKASEESDEAPEKKKAASTAPLIPSSLRHSESYDS